MPRLAAKERILPDAGKHLCVLTAVEVIDNKFYDPKKDKTDKATRVQWTFTYKDKPEITTLVWSSCSLSTYKGTKSNALRITEALLDHELSKEELHVGLDTEPLIEKECYLDVRHLKDEDGDTIAKVKDFIGAVSGMPF